jgi:Skp family chaperone for outer membrane proteins
MRRKLEEPDDDRDTRPQVKVVEKPVVVEKGYSQADLDAAVARAVEQSVHKVETLRKQRKVEKQKAITQKQHDAKVFQDINGALKNDVWASCFL